VYYKADAPEHWGVESAGLPRSAAGEVVVTRFNDPQMLRDHFRQYGDRLACFIVEPFIGSGGYMAASPEYIQAARELTRQHGALLIFDEVISGFRFRAGDLGGRYGVKADLATFAKIMGGGMPVAAVAGRADVMALCSRYGGAVRFSGGTYSGHPASMIAARAMLEHLVAHENEIYPRINALGAALRQTTEAAFAAEGIQVRCTGYPNAVMPGSSMAMPHFVLRSGTHLASPDVVNDPDMCDAEMREHVLQLALLCEDVHVVHGLGAVSYAHSEDDLVFFEGACRKVARRLAPYLA
jgi:glutamate-1-semialdehyde 2,1-aminomutase